MEAKLACIDMMKADRGFDVVIVCTSDEHQAAFWSNKLKKARGSVVPKSSSVVAVDEDWPGGAGNFFGTLYAWHKACTVLKETEGRDLRAELRGGKSVALFHTAGKGTRLAPLPGGENNNKPGVKLPVPGSVSILESVIRQTGAFASSRPSRLSVFWGDQVFVPSTSTEYTPRHHADIACALGPMPSAEEWQDQGLDKYGLIAASDDGDVAAMLEKVTHAEAAAGLEGKAVSKVGWSLGSFSLSAALLGVLEAGFAQELESKVGKMDSDPHVWMPLTLGADRYAGLMVQKGLFSDAGARAHHTRIRDMIAATRDGKLAGPLFGTVDVGRDCSWWDYGQLRLYLKNALLLTEDSEDAQLARRFFGIADSCRTSSESSLGESTVDSASVISASSCKSGSFKSAVVSAAFADSIVAEGAVLVNVTARKIVARPGALAYNIVDDSEEGLVLDENEVLVGVATSRGSDSQYFTMASNWMQHDGGQVFKERIHDNPYSFQEVYDLNMGVSVMECATFAEQRRSDFLTKYFGDDESQKRRRILAGSLA
mmetsp:Transcript_16733/g.37522  ORF Transcript_16733/g.37522 Transcript_16733/m.37522 type:complete len:541 (-) Transcript_16733:89-1711(-)